MHNLKYQRSQTFGCNDIENRKSEVVMKLNFFLILFLNTWNPKKTL